MFFGRNIRKLFNYSLKLVASNQNFSVKSSAIPWNFLLMEKSAKRPIRISIEGNIGAGKSTLLKHFEGIDWIETHGEPIDLWRNFHGYNLLDLLYTDINKWLKVFQSYVQVTRTNLQTAPPKSDDIKMQIFERSIQNNRFCFMEQAYTNGYLHFLDYAILDQHFKLLQKNLDISLDLIVYLRTTPEVVFERVKLRNRPEEANLSLEYLKGLHESHEKWLLSKDKKLNNIPVVVLDGDKPLDKFEFKVIDDIIFDWERVFCTEDNNIRTVL